MHFRGNRRCISEEASDGRRQRADAGRTPRGHRHGRARWAMLCRAQVSRASHRDRQSLRSDGGARDSHPERARHGADSRRHHLHRRERPRHRPVRGPVHRAQRHGLQLVRDRGREGRDHGQRRRQLQGRVVRQHRRRARRAHPRLPCGPAHGARPRRQRGRVHGALPGRAGSGQHGRVQHDAELLRHQVRGALRRREGRQHPQTRRARAHLRGGPQRALARGHLHL